MQGTSGKAAQVATETVQGAHDAPAGARDVGRPDAAPGAAPESRLAARPLLDVLPPSAPGWLMGIVFGAWALIVVGFYIRQLVPAGLGRILGRLLPW